MTLGILSRYGKQLPFLETTESPLTLGEGNTPLIPLDNLSAYYKLPKNNRLWAKIEGSNPTGSFKDRGMVVAVAAAKAKGATGVVCASTGNTSASAAAYAGRAKMPCIVLIPSGKVAMGKIAQAVAHGARIVQIAGNFDDAMYVVRQFSDKGAVAVVNSINPMRIQGQKTAAFEVIEQLDAVPDYHALPVGNAGNITAHWIGYSELLAKKTAACLYCGGECFYTHPAPRDGKAPIMLGYQAEGSAPFIHGAAVSKPETIATAIRIGNPQSFVAARKVIEESQGWFAAISDEDILYTQRLLAEKEGIFCEPASATSVSGAIRDIRCGKIPENSQVVCTLTGHGLKDPSIFPMPKIQVTPIDGLEQFIDDIVKGLKQ